MEHNKKKIACISDLIFSSCCVNGENCSSQTWHLPWENWLHCYRDNSVVFDRYLRWVLLFCLLVYHESFSPLSPSKWNNLGFFFLLMLHCNDLFLEELSCHYNTELEENITSAHLQSWPLKRIRSSKNQFLLK